MSAHPNAATHLRRLVPGERMKTFKFVVSHSTSLATHQKFSVFYIQYINKFYKALIFKEILIGI